jgi:glutathione S-transferase
MPQIATTNEEVRNLSGLHLYHDPLSSCAMRVRMVLAEKNLAWHSRIIDLAKMEHATSEYQSINPNGVVPTLIHDGRTYIESIDIIQYLDGLVATPSLTPADPKEQADCRTLTIAADDAQISLKTLTHEFLFRGIGRYLGDDDQRKFATEHRNAWLVDFKRAFAAGGAKWQSQVSAALGTMDGHFRALDGKLATTEWLAGGNFTMADIAWTPQVHRMSLMEWPMESYPHLSRWYAQLQKRPSFQEAVIDCEPPGARAMFARYAAQRSKENTSVADLLKRPPVGGA